jgi:hypothetical protein
MSEAAPMTDDQQQHWVKEKYQTATKYLAEKGVVTDSVQLAESRYLVPLLAVWKLTAIGGKKYWVLCGDLPSDHIAAEVAPNAQEALRHFSLKWQIQAENLLKADSKDQNDFAELLIGRADGLYKLYNDESLWGSK